MAQKKSYSRYFIILQEDERGYALASDKLPTGYVKLELKNDKCKVSYYVQNLKKESAPYYMTLILGKKDINKIIKIGELNIDNYGRAEISYEYSADNIADTEMSMDNVSGAAIVKFLDKNIISVLSGFLTSDIPRWKEYEIIDSMANKERFEENVEQEVVEKVQEKIEEEKVEQKIEQKIEEKIEEEKVERGPEEEKSIFDVYEESIEQGKHEVEDLQSEADEVAQQEETIVQVVDRKEEVDVNNEEIKETIEEQEEDKSRNNIEENIAKNKDFRNDERNKKWPNGKAGEFFKEIAKGLKEIEGEITDIKKCIWYKVPIKHVNDMYCISDYNKYSIIYYPMINYYKYIKPYGYYFIGYKCDNEGKMKYLVYGIPGRKDRRDQPFGGKTGFVTWVPSKSGKNECEGYWLMFYDFRTSTILIPVK